MARTTDVRQLQPGTGMGRSAAFERALQSRACRGHPTRPANVAGAENASSDDVLNTNHRKRSEWKGQVTLPKAGDCATSILGLVLRAARRAGLKNVGVHVHRHTSARTWR